MLGKVNVKVKLSLYLTNSALRQEGVSSNGYIFIDQRVPHFGTSWR
jgi:hypothetical protein